MDNNIFSPQYKTEYHILLLYDYLSIILFAYGLSICITLKMWLVNGIASSNGKVADHELILCIPVGCVVLLISEFPSTEKYTFLGVVLLLSCVSVSSIPAVGKQPCVRSLPTSCMIRFHDTSCHCLFGMSICHHTVL